MGGRLRHCSDALSTSRRYTVSFLFYLLSLTSAIPQNITIDDQFGDEQTGVLPGYSPVGAWSQGADCSGCLIKPDARRAFRGTWHDATHTPGDEEPRVASLQFNGTAIYAYFIIPNTVQFATTLTNTTFELDGEFVGRFEHVPTSEETFEFNVPGYANTTLLPGHHQLNIIGTGDTNSSVILFDYAVYTFDPLLIISSSSTPTSLAPQETSSAPTLPTLKSSSTGVIVGSVIGALALVAIIIAFLFCYRRRRQRNLTGVDDITNVAQVEPFMGEVVRADMLVTTHDRSRSVFGHEVVNHAISGSSFTPSSSTFLLRSLDNTAPSPESASSLPRSDVAQVQPNCSPQPQPQARSRTQTRTSMRCADSKSSQRQELQQRMEDVQNTIATLRHQASLRGSSSRNSPGLHVQNSDSNVSTGQMGDVSDTALLAYPMFGQDPIRGSQVRSVTASEDFSGRGGETEPLRQRIAELQAEVEMLRAQQDLLRVNDEPPPVYEESDRDPVVRDRSRSAR